MEGKTFGIIFGNFCIHIKERRVREREKHTFPFFFCGVSRIFCLWVLHPQTHLLCLPPPAPDTTHFLYTFLVYHMHVFRCVFYIFWWVGFKVEHLYNSTVYFCSSSLLLISSLAFVLRFSMTFNVFFFFYLFFLLPMFPFPFQIRKFI